MLDTTMMISSLHDVIDVGYETCTHVVFRKAL